MPRNDTTQALLRSPELTLLPALANTLIIESCSKDAIAIALHPARYMRRRVSKKARDGAGMILRDTPLLRNIAKHLVAVAKRFLADVPEPKPRLCKNIAGNVKRYLALRVKQHASDNELLAIRVFMEALGYMRASYRPKPKTRPRREPRWSAGTSDGVYMTHDSIY